MTMTSSAQAALCLLFAAGVATTTAHAGTWLGAGVASFGGAMGQDESSDGLEIFAGKDLRPWLAIEAGVIDQQGDYLFVINQNEVIPRHLTNYDWRAVHAGPRFNWALGDRWQVHAGIALAHVSSERSRIGATQDAAGVVTYFNDSSYQDASWGALGTFGVSFDVTPRQRLSLDFKRLHAGLGERCEYREEFGGFECGKLDHQSADGITLAWSHRFD